jgi:hypothetical protein
MFTNILLPDVKVTRKMDYTTSSHNDMLASVDLLLELGDLSRQLGITCSGVLTLLVLYREFNTTGMGLNTYQICLKLNYTGNNLNMMQHRMVRYQSLGYIEVFGTGERHTKVFTVSKSVRDTLDRFYKV